MKLLLKKIWRFFNPQHIIYYKHQDKDMAIHVKSIDKKTKNLIKGKTINNENFEICSGDKSLEYYIEEYKDDLVREKKTK